MKSVLKRSIKLNRVGMERGLLLSASIDKAADPSDPYNIPVVLNFSRLVGILIGWTATLELLAPSHLFYHHIWRRRAFRR
jgi:hypothetical protein